MTTVSFSGYSYALNDDDVIVFGRAILTFTGASDVLMFSYSIAEDLGVFSPITLDFDPYSSVVVTSGDQALSLGSADVLLYLGTYFWDGGTGAGAAQIFDVTTSPTSGYVFNLDGSSLPDLLDPNTARAWYNSIFDYQLVERGLLAIDSSVSLTELGHAETGSGADSGADVGVVRSGGPDDDTFSGGEGSDLLLGRGGSDVLSGRGGDDRLLGNGGDDILLGGAGDDILRGGRGDDRLTGGRGNDKLWGADGADRFIYDASLSNGTDRIKDFDQSRDLIVIAGLGGFDDLSLSDVARGAKIVFGDSAIIVAGFEAAALGADDFLFV